MVWHLKRSHWVIAFALLAAVLTGLAIAWFARPVMERAAAMTESTEFDQAPVYIGLQPVPEPGLRPFAMALQGSKLLVSYLGSDRIDEFSEKLEYLRTLHLLDKAPASITGLAVDGDRIFAADFTSGDLLFADYKTGKLLRAYGWHPGHTARMKALGVTFYSNTLYVSDVASRQMLAIGAQDEPKLREEGELITRFPNGRAAELELGYPTWTMVTADGRLLVSDAKSGEIKVFTCNGRSAYLFGKEGAALRTPMGIAMDTVVSPALIKEAKEKFDPSPSRISDQGRIHVVDAAPAGVKVFDALGKYVLSYGTELKQPNGIAIDQKRRLIFISDTALHAIAVYKY